MLHDIFPCVYRNSYENKKPEESSLLMFVKGEEILCLKEEEEYIYPSFFQCDTSGIEIRYLFSIDNKSYFLAFEEKYISSDAKNFSCYAKLVEKLQTRGFQFVNRMRLRRGAEKMSAFVGSVAYQLASWYADNRICGRCGHVLVHDEKERMMKCEACGNMIFPKICPAVIVAVTDGERLILTKYPGRVSHFALIAGYAETGETIEDTVHREVMEEVGIKVKNLRYYKSQPWGFTDTLLFGFFCEPEGDKQLKIDKNELAYADWLTRKDIEDVCDDGISLTYEMIRVFKEGNAF